MLALHHDQLPHFFSDQHQSGMEGADNKSENYLALDGGLSGLSGLVTLEELLSRLQFDLKLKEELARWRYFKIIIGTGPGGLVTIFIGRLKMTASEAIETYTRLLPTLSVLSAKDDEERRLNTEAFKEAFIIVLKDAGYDSGTPMLDDDAPKTVVVTTNVVNPTLPHFIRSYRVRGSPAPPCTILQAACACIASQDRFLPVVIGEGHMRVTLVDAIAGYANPTKELMREAQSVFGEEAEVSTILSLGAGKIVPLENGREDLFEILKRGGIVCEQVHEDMQKRLKDTSVYFRFNAESEMGTMTESISARTSAYLHEEAISEKLDQATKSVHNRPSGIKLKDINSVTAIEIQLKPRPSLVPNFVGRDDILQSMHQTHILNRSPGLRTPAITVLSGLGGSGKTQIALKFALDFEDLNPEASVYFLNAESEESLKADFETLIRSQGTEHRSKSCQDALVWLATKLKNWLLILDNADNPSVRLFSCIPKTPFGNIIITTRNANHATLAPNAAHSIEGLSEPDSVSLVIQSSGYENTETNRALATGIVRELGNLPLALAQAAGYIFVNKCLSTYLEIYRSSHVKILASFSSQRPDDYPSSVARTIEMSMDRLPQQAQDILRIFVHLDSTSIPHAIIAKAAERQFEHVTDTKRSEVRPETVEHTKALQSVFGNGEEWSDFDFNELITKCLQYSLLRITRQGDNKFYSMHILVQSYLKASATLIQGHQPSQLVIRLLGSSITTGERYEFLPFNRLLLPHIRLIQLEDVMEAGDHYGFGRALDVMGDRRLALAHQERCVEMWRTSLGEEHQNTLTALTTLAIYYKNIERIQEAVEVEEQVLALERKQLGAEHPNTLIDMHNLASSYRKLGRNGEAMEMGEQVLKLRQKVLGPEDPSTLSAINNLAAIYTSLGRVHDALKLEEKVLELRRKVLGPDHPDTLTSMYNLALSYNQMGRIREQAELEEQVVELRTRVLGFEHPDTVNAMWNLACSFESLGLNQRRIDMLRIAAPAHEKAFGVDHWKTIRATTELKEVLAELSQQEDVATS